MTAAELARQQIDGPLAIQAATARQTAATLAVLAPFIRRLSEMVAQQDLAMAENPFGSRRRLRRLLGQPQRSRRHRACGDSPDRLVRVDLPGPPVHTGVSETFLTQAWATLERIGTDLE